MSALQVTDKVGQKLWNLCSRGSSFTVRKAVARDTSEPSHGHLMTVGVVLYDVKKTYVSLWNLVTFPS